MQKIILPPFFALSLIQAGLMSCSVFDKHGMELGGVKGGIKLEGLRGLVIGYKKARSNGGLS